MFVRGGEHGSNWDDLGLVNPSSLPVPAKLQLLAVPFAWLDAAGVPYEQMVIPDDTHHWMLYANNLRVNAAIADFFARKLLQQKP